MNGSNNFVRLTKLRACIAIEGSLKFFDLSQLIQGCVVLVRLEAKK